MNLFKKPQVTEADKAFREVDVDGTIVKIFGRPEDHYFSNMTLADHTNDFLSWVCKHHIAKDATIFDVGANIGLTTSMMALAAPEGDIYSFEPSPTAYPFLAHTIANNVTNKRCHPFNVAVGAQAGTVGFSDNPVSAAASHLSQGALGHSTTQVKIITLDNFATEMGIKRLDLIKIDVEGFETGVLAGASQTRGTLRPDVFLEFNSFTLIAYGNQNPREFLELLLMLFPHVYRFEGGKPVEIRSQSEVLAFIHTNLTAHRLVDDLYCRHSPLN